VAIFDNHIHLRASFKGVEAAKAFEKAGGTAILLTHSPYPEVPITRADDYRAAYGLTLSMADAVRAATHLEVFVALGPYPVEFIHLRETLGDARAADAMRRAIDLAAKSIREGKAVAFGEVGRPHFPVAADIVRACNDTVAYAMAQAKDIECAVVLHTEDPTPATFAEFAAMASRAGLDPKYVVKHHSTPFTRLEDTAGLVPSILAKEDLVAEALKGGPRFLLETDYIDDPNRPGAVLGPATVPKKTRAWLERGLLSKDQAWSIHHDLPEKTYRIEIE
jgi:TatD-related deoxyribonuclease